MENDKDKLKKDADKPSKGNFIEEQEQLRKSQPPTAEDTGQQGDVGTKGRDQQPNWSSDKTDAGTLADQPPVAPIGNQPGGGGSRRPSR
jgi:hypothetical protein